MYFYEALMLGSTLPLCRTKWRDGEKGCLITNAFREAGFELERDLYYDNVSQIRIRFFSEFPVCKAQVLAMELTYRIINSFDKENPDTIEEIVTKVKEIEMEFRQKRTPTKPIFEPKKLEPAEVKSKVNQ